MEVRFEGYEALGWRQGQDLSDPWLQALDEDMGRLIRHAKAVGWMCSAGLCVAGTIAAACLMPFAYAITVAALTLAATAYCGWRAFSLLRPRRLESGYAGLVNSGV